MIEIKYKFKSIEQDGHTLTAVYTVDTSSVYQIAREVYDEYFEARPSINVTFGSWLETFAPIPEVSNGD